MSISGSSSAPFRTRISPSDLTFLWSSCKRCFWLKYRIGFELPSVFPGIVNALSSRQEAWYKASSSAEFSTGLPAGRVHSSNKLCSSAPLTLGDDVTPFILSGKYDFLLAYDDGTFGIVDTKLSTKIGKVELYWPQLAAYRYMLAAPSKGEARICQTLGLMIWLPTSASRRADGSLTIGFDAVYEEVVVAEDRFKELMREVLVCLASKTAPEISDCDVCQAIEDYPLSQSS